MESSNSLKRRQQNSSDICIVCQDTKADVLKRKKVQSIDTLKEQAQIRKRFRDLSKYGTIYQIEKLEPGVSIIILCVTGNATLCRAITILYEEMDEAYQLRFVYVLPT